MRDRRSWALTTVVAVVIAALFAGQARAAIVVTGDYGPDPLHSGDGVVNGELQLGYSGVSEITVTGGDELRTTDRAFLPYQVGATGNVIVTDSTWTAEGAVFIGSQALATGRVDLTNSTWTVDSNVRLAQGDDSVAEVTLSGGSTWGTLFSVTVATGEDCTGTVNLIDGTWTAQAGVTFGGSGFVGSNGDGQLKIKAAGMMDAKMGVDITSFGSAELDGGTLLLSGESTFEGAVTATANGGTIRLLVGPSPDGWGLINVGDGVDFTGCDLEIGFHDTFTPPTVMVFDVFDALGPVDLATALGDATSITTPTNWELDMTSGELSYVPEPGTMLLLGLGLGTLAVLRRRRQAFTQGGGRLSHANGKG